MTTAIILALAAALAFGASTALMHHGASSAPHDIGGTRALLAHVVMQWRWLLGMLASLLGLALHALALGAGTLTLVQPIVVSGLVFSFVFRSALDRRLPPPHALAWVSVTAVGLAVFLLGANSARSSDHLNEPAALIVLTGGAIIAIGTCIASVRADPIVAGLLLGLSAGVVFGLIAGTLKATTTTASNGTLFSSWPIYALLPLGTAGFLLNQRTYHRASLASSLPALNVANPVVAVLFGILVFQERPSDQPAAILAQALGLITVLLGIIVLARASPP